MRFGYLFMPSASEKKVTDRPSTGAQRRSFWWWLGAVLAPLGILGGPVAMADLFSGLIEWRGPIGFLVSYWDRAISEPFHRIFQFVVDSIPWDLSFPAWFSDYVALGILLVTSLYRALFLIVAYFPTLKSDGEGDAHDSANSFRAETPRERLLLFSWRLAKFIRLLLMALLIPIAPIISVLIWPIGFLMLPTLFALGMWKSEPREERKMIARMLILTYLPFGLFVLLFLANLLFAPAGWHL